MLNTSLWVTAIAAGVLAVAPLARDSRADRPTAPAAAATTDAAAEPPPTDTVPEDARPGSWSLRAGGWYIRVDGAEVDVPKVAELTEHRRLLARPASISPFDRLIAHHARAEGFDWRLVAALIFEESRFDPSSESDKGAYGLMQVRPIAAHAVGVDRFQAPNDNLNAGVRYLRLLDEKFRDAGDRDRIGLVLAAYNMGPGHVRDAQRVARHFGFDPNRWEGHMERILPLLELPSIYTKLPNGFAKGRDTVAYVQRTIERYHHYQRQTSGAPAADTAALPPAANG